MKRYLPILAMPFVIVACTRFQYVTVNSTDTHKNANSQFVVDNDSLRFSYDFNGKNGPVNITVQNKMTRPVYVDWKNSALTINDSTISYMPSDVQFDGTVSNYRYHYSPVTSGSIIGDAKLPRDVDYIPPGSYISKTTVNLLTNFFNSIPDSVFRQVAVETVDGSNLSVKQAAFDATNSPLRFNSYLNYKVGDLSAQPTSLRQSFYVHEVTNTGTNPRNLRSFNEERGNHAYLEKTTEGGKVVGVVLLLGVFVAFALIGHAHATAN